jgi:hypothetical protein
VLSVHVHKDRILPVSQVHKVILGDRLAVAVLNGRVSDCRALPIAPDQIEAETDERSDQYGE